MGLRESETLDAFMERLWYDSTHDFDLFSSALRERVAQAWGEGAALAGGSQPDPLTELNPYRESGPRVGTLDDDERCGRCGGENVTWAAPSPLWNLVMRGNDIDGEAQYADLVCIRCFIVLAEKAGIRGQWRVSVHPEPEGLIYETPSGRVWNADQWLWVDPNAESS